MRDFLHPDDIVWLGKFAAEYLSAPIATVIFVAVGGLLLWLYHPLFEGPVEEYTRSQNLRIAIICGIAICAMCGINLIEGLVWLVTR